MNNKLIDNFFTKTISFVQSHRDEYGENFSQIILELKTLQANPKLLAKMSNDPTQIEIDKDGISRAVHYSSDRPNVRLSDKTPVRINHAFFRAIFAIESYFFAIKELDSQKRVGKFGTLSTYEKDLKEKEIEMNGYVENFINQIDKKDLYTRAIDKLSPNMGKQKTDKFIKKYLNLHKVSVH